MPQHARGLARHDLAGAGGLRRVEPAGPHGRRRCHTGPNAGPGGRALTLKPGGSVTWKVRADTVDIGYRTRFAGGPLQIEVDGKIPLNGIGVATDTDPSAQRQVWSSDDLGPGEHTVTVRNAQPSASSSSATVTDLTTQTPTHLKDSLSLDPDLLLIPLGFNDRRANVPAAEFGRSLDSLIQQARRMGYDGPILLVGMVRPDPSPGAQWSGYLRQMAARIDHEGVSFIDLSAVLPAANPPADVG